MRAGRQRSARVRERVEDETLLALKVEEGAPGQGIQVPLEARKNKEMVLLKAPRKHLDYSQVTPISDF